MQVPVPHVPEAVAGRGEADAHGRVLRNVTLNIAAYAVPTLVALVAIKYAVAGLGRERFGVLALIWSVLSYFSFFDLGVGRAITQKLPALLESGDADGVRRLVGTAVAVVVILGISAGVLLGLLAPWLANHAVSIPAGLRGEALGAFRVLALTVPLLIVTAGLRSTLEGAERFGLANLVRLPQSVLVFVFPALAPIFGWDLVAITWASLVTVVLAGFVYAAFILTIIPATRRIRIDPSVLSALAGYGGWMTAAQLIWSFMLQLDRFAIGFLLGTAFVAYYAAPYEMISRAWVLSSALIALLPAVARLGLERPAAIADLAVWSVRQVLLVAGLPLLFVAAFSGTLLKVWLGSDFAQHSAAALSLLAVALLLSVQASVPDLVIKGLGRPRTVALIHACLIGPYCLALFLLIPRFGITGAALAWLARAVVESALLFRAAAALVPAMRHFIRDPALGRLLVFLVAYAAVLAAIALLLPAAPGILVAAAVVAAAVVVAWGWLLSGPERLQLKRLVRFA